MEKILKADLTTEGIEVLDYEPKSWGCYGRGLALKLVASSVPHDAGRYSPENAIALVPGILTGCKVASCCRVTIASKRGKGEGLQVCNVSGNLPQKMASLSIAGLLICGKSTEKNAVLHIGEDSAEIIHMPELERKDTGTIVERLKKRFGADAAILGVGKAADMQLSLSTFFCTYPDGDPNTTVPETGLGIFREARGSGQWWLQETDILGVSAGIGITFLKPEKGWPVSSWKARCAVRLFRPMAPSLCWNS